MTKALAVLVRRVADALRDLAPIIVVIAFFQIFDLVSDEKTDIVLGAARAGGATGATIITSVRGEGLAPEKTFFGLDLAAHRDIVLCLVIEQRARDILERIRDACRFEEEPGAGIAFLIPIEDAVGLSTQVPTILEELEHEI